jgi:hypothetical protein
MPPLNSANIVEEQPSPLNIKKKQSLMGAEPGNSPTNNNNGQVRI